MAIAEENGTALSPVETAKLENLEVVISDGMKSFVSVGRALLEIRDGRLYRATHMNFEDYCQEKWDMSRVHAHRLAEAAAVVDLLPIGSKPTNEAQARPLTRLPSEDRASAWREAVAAAPNGKPTAAIVEEVVSKRLPDSETEADEDERPAKKKKAEPKTENYAEKEAREFTAGFLVKLDKLTDGGVYTTDQIAEIAGVKSSIVPWFIRMCDVSPAVKVHRTLGRKGLCQYTFEATRAVTAHARIKQLAEKIASDQSATSKIQSAASEILSLLGG